jgi:hypothetical protein
MLLLAAVCLDVIADLDSGSIPQGSMHLEELVDTIQSLNQRHRQSSKSAVARRNPGIQV